MEKQDTYNNVVYEWDKETYTWGREHACIRNGEPMIQNGEIHCCYFCGEPIDFENLKPCSNCHAVACPNCGKCFCNISEAEQIALRVLRDKYCCSEEGFRNGVQPEDFWLYSYVPAFEKCLNYCRRQRGV